MPTSTPTPLTQVPVADAGDLSLHRTAVWRYLRALGAAPGEADDLVQETLLVACRERPRDPATMRAFLRGIGKNLWLRSRRWWRRRREREVAAAVDELWLATAGDDGEELIERLRECLAALQARTRRALDLHYRDGLPWLAIAPQIGLSPNGTKTLVQRARAVLRTCIEGGRS